MNLLDQGKNLAFEEGGKIYVGAFVKVVEASGKGVVQGVSEIYQFAQRLTTDPRPHH